MTHLLRRLISIAPGLLVAGAAVSWGTSVTWIGDDGDWMIGDNWDSGGVPSGQSAIVTGEGQVARIQHPAPGLLGLSVEADAVVAVEEGGRIASMVTVDGGRLLIDGGSLGRNQADSVARNPLQVMPRSSVDLYSGFLLTSGISLVEGEVNVAGGTWNHSGRIDLGGTLAVRGGVLQTGNSQLRDVGPSRIRIEGSREDGKSIALGAGGFRISHAETIMEFRFDTFSSVDPVAATGPVSVESGTIRIGLAKGLGPEFDPGALLGFQTLFASKGSLEVAGVNLVGESGIELGNVGLASGTGEWSGYNLWQVEIAKLPVYWTGGDGNWADAANWSGGEIPAADSALVRGEGRRARITGPAATLGRLHVEDGAVVSLHGGGRMAAPVEIEGGAVWIVGGVLGRNQANEVERNVLRVGADSALRLINGNLLTNGVAAIAGRMSIRGGTWNHTNRIDLSGNFAMDGGTLVTGSGVMRDVAPATLTVKGQWGEGQSIHLGAGGLALTHPGSMFEVLLNEEGRIEPIRTSGGVTFSNVAIRIDLSEGVSPAIESATFMGNHPLIAALDEIELDGVALELGPAMEARGLTADFAVIDGSGAWSGYEVLEIRIRAIPEEVDTTWVGGVGDWSVESNWFPAGVPSEVRAGVMGAESVAHITGVVPGLDGLSVRDGGTVRLALGGRLASPVTVDGGLLLLEGGIVGRNQANAVARNPLQVMDDSSLIIRSGQLLTSGASYSAGEIRLEGGTWNHTGRIDLRGKTILSGGSLTTASGVVRNVGSAELTVIGRWANGGGIALGPGGLEWTGSEASLEFLFEEAGGIEPVVTAGSAVLKDITIRVGLVPELEGDVDELSGIQGTHVVVAAQGGLSFENIAMVIDGRLRLNDWTVGAGSGSWAGYTVLMVDLGPATEEELYNGIVLPGEWPPTYMADDASLNPLPVPYLDVPPAVIPINVGRQLFVDNFLVEATNLTRTFHQAVKHPDNPIFYPETEGELGIGDFVPMAAPFSDGVWYDPKSNVFKMWYQAAYFDGTAYAVSPDGLNWERPDLDVVPGTNRVLPNRDGVTRDSSAVILNHDAIDPTERFNMLLYTRPAQRGEVYTSADGIHWGEPIETFEMGDRSTIFYNPFRRKWVYSIRSSWDRRSRDYVETDDLILGAIAPQNRVHWLRVDNLDQADPEIGDRPQLYNFDAVAYESLMLGAFTVHLGPSNTVINETGIPKITEIHIGFSRDGFHWSRPDDRTPFIAASRTEGSWDRGYLHSNAALCLVMEDELWFYYTGFAGDTTLVNRTPRYTGGAYANGATGLAILRRDGFASMDAGETTGTLTTRPVIFEGRYLFVNIDNPEGELRVEVLDENGVPIDGFGVEESKAVSADSTRIRVEWNDQEDLAPLANRPVKFRFYLTNGSLYAFWVSPDEAGSSQGYLAGGGPGFRGAVDDVGRIERAAGGTPHWWLVENGLVEAGASPEAFDQAEMMDLLGKGFTAREEYIAGTDPRDPSSRLKVREIDLGVEGITLRWDAVSGRWYSVFSRDRLTAGGWERIHGPVWYAADQLATFTDSSIGGAKRFYRIGVERK